MKHHHTMGNQCQLNPSSISKRHLGKLAASPAAEWKRPFWVRSVDKPTVDIDWERMKRFDGRRMMQVSFSDYVGEAENQRLEREMKEKVKQWILEEKPGYMLKDRALDIAGRTGSIQTTFLGSWHDPERKKGSWAGEISGPAEMGVPRYAGDPKENSHMIRAALRHFGADQVGFVELDEHTRKLIYSFDAEDGKKIEFENVDTAYETEKKRVIPHKAKWVIVFSIQMSEEQIKLNIGSSPTPVSSAATGLVYSRSATIIDRLQNFLHMLGYQGLMGTWYNGLGIAPAFGVLAGLGELSRINRLISPEYGPMQRVYKVITDLPMAPTKPIDAGIMRFCRTCKKCAEACPSGALSMDTEPSWQVKGPWNNPGVKAYFDYGPKCLSYWITSTASCARCLAVCPFTSKNASFIHTLVKSTLSVSPVMNQFLIFMYNLFGYGNARNPESWWKLNMPPYGVDTARAVQSDKQLFKTPD